MNSKFLNKKILIPLLCGIGCFTLTFLLTKAINHDEGKSLEITSRNKKLLSNLEEIDLEIISFKKQILGAKDEISALKSQKENLQLSLGVEIEETIETEDEEDVDLDLSLPEDEKDTSYYHYYEQEHSYSTYGRNENSNSIDNSSDSSLNYGNSPIIENNPEASVPPVVTLPENNSPVDNTPGPGIDLDNNENIESTPPSVDEDDIISDSSPDTDGNIDEPLNTEENSLTNGDIN